MTFDGRAVANYVLDHCERQKVKLSNLALQKIVYFCHAWSLIVLGRPLIKQQFEAWPHGPVLPYLYHEFKEFGSEYISGKRARAVNPITGQMEIARIFFDEDLADLLPAVIDVYARLSAAELCELSHIEGGPWDTVWNHKSRINPGMKINDLFIQCFHSKMRVPFVVQ